MMVSNYILLTSFLKFHNVAQLLCNFCPICNCPSRTAGRQWNKENRSQQIPVADHHGHPVYVTAIVSAVLGVCQFLLSSVSITLMNVAAVNQANRLRAVFYKAVLRQEISWYDKNGSGSFAEQLSQ